MAAKKLKKPQRIITLVKDLPAAPSLLMATSKVSKIGSSARDLEQGLLDFFDGKLKNNLLAQQAIKEKNARLLFLLAAQVSVGIREVGGNNKGPMVELIQKTIGGASREAWCMAFVQSCLEYAEEMTGVVSPLYVSEHCQTVWNKTAKTQRVKYHPLAGAIAIWRHGNTTNGHTGVLESADNKIFYAYEGNTESGLANGKVERDGGGVYRTQRGITGNGNMKIMGFLKPF